jgi:DNA polymerase-1
MNIITTREQLDEFVQAYSDVDAFAYDCETIGEHRVNTIINDVCWLSFSTEGRVDVIPMGHPNGEFEFWTKPLLLSGKRRVAEGKPLSDTHFSKNSKLWIPQFTDPPEQLTPAEVFSAIKPIMFGPALKIGHNLKFDLKSVAKYYKTTIPSGPYFDTMMAGFIVDNRNRHKLSLLFSVERELGIKIEKGVGEDISIHSFSEVAKYAGIDADVTWKLYKALAPKLVGNLSRVWKLEMDCLPALCDMELAGAVIDRNQLDLLSTQITADKMEAEKRVYRLAGKNFSINSVPAKQELLFSVQEGMKTPRIKPNPKMKIALTPKGQEARANNAPILPHHFAVSAEALEMYRGQDELVDALLEYQDLNKILTTYVTPYAGGEVRRVTNGKEKLIDKKSLLIKGRVHTDFKAHGAETGRLSSANPNLQNIPSSGEYGKLIRNLFVAPQGYKLVVADYSQIEPRIIASFSKDPVMTDTYMNGGDIYTAIGDTMGVDRKAGKVLVLAISYGVGPDKIASSIGCTVKEARELLANFEDKFSSVTKYKGAVVRLARQIKPVPYVETILGRRRYIPDLLSKEQGFLSRAERQAFNTVIQGSAADVMKLAIVRAHSCFIDEPDINVILTVHDELVTLCPEDRVDETVEAIRVSMEGIKLSQITIPLTAGIGVVDRWGEAK